MRNRSRAFLREFLRQTEIALGSLFFCLVLLTGFFGQLSAETTPALEDAQSFLELIDAGNFPQAWWEGSELLHLNSELDDWVESSRIRHDLFGEFSERRVKTFSVRSSYPGLPDGEYAILLFDSSFEHKQAALEMLVMVKDPYGGWKVVSYRLR